MEVDEGLLKFCTTEVQTNYLQALIDAKGSHKKAAKVCGVARSTISKSLARVKRTAEKRGYSPEHEMRHPVPPAFMVKGTSTLYNEEGDVSLQWVKSDRIRERDYETAIDLYESLGEGVNRLKPIKAPKSVDSDLLTFYPFTDAHIGMVCVDRTDKATREWGLDHSKDILIDCCQRMLAATPPSDQCVIGQLGDFLHWDSLFPLTPASGHILDADGFLGEMVETGVFVLRSLIDLCLQKHGKVHIINSEGNHDPATAVCLRVLLNCVYEKEPRVTVDMSQHPYAAFEHGRNLLVCHHGHLKAPAQLHKVMVTDFSEKWGRADFRYGHMGHKHHTSMIETSGALITQHTTLAPRDRYASRHGFSSIPEARAITYHKDKGEISQVVIRPYA